jgi:hypothetical protein
MIIEKLVIFLRLDSVLLFKIVKHIAGCGAVGSASGLGPEGRQFESGHPD